MGAFGTIAVLLILGEVAEGAWKLSHNLTGDSFFDGFDFFTQP